MALHFDEGDKPRLTATFEDSSGTDIDPTAVFFKFTNPGGTVATYEYGVDAELVKSATGIYYVDLDLNADGRWLWRWYATGTGQSAEQGYIIVDAANQ